MQYNNSIPYYQSNIPYMNNNYTRTLPVNRRIGPNDRFGGFLFPFALGFVSSPLLFGATRPRPYPYYPAPGYYPYY